MLNIENQFLSRSDIKSALKISEVNAVRKQLLNGRKKSFEQSLQLGALVVNAVNWYEGEGKQALSEAGIEWKKEDLFKNVFGFQRSFAYKLIKANEVEAEKVEEFKGLCAEADRRGETAPLSIEGLLKWVKNGGGSVVAESEGEGEGEGEGTQSVPTIFTLSYKTDEGNVAVRVNANGEVATKNSVEDIEKAIAYLRAQLSA